MDPREDPSILKNYTESEDTAFTTAGQQDDDEEMAEEMASLGLDGEELSQEELLERLRVEVRGRGRVGS